LLSQSLRDDIELTVEMTEGLWPVAVDVTEFELALLNIGVNARDAMPEGGRLEVETRNVSFSPGGTPGEPLTGDFVALRLSDTGMGMTSEVRMRAFEPFFTTKEVGLGSGLGLSQVYGFARQSGGAASIVSAMGKGTSITLFLPRAGEEHAAAASDVTAAPLALPGRILVV